MQKIIKDLSALKDVITKSGLVTFDLDGTFANTEPYHLESYQKYCREKFNINVTDIEFKDYMGHIDDDIFKMIGKRHDVKIENIDKIINERLDTYLKIVKYYNLKPYKYIYEFIEKWPYKDKFILSSQREDVILKMIDLWSLKSFFKENQIISTRHKNFKKEDVINNIEKFTNINPSQYVIFEDVNRILKELKRENNIIVGIEHDFNKGSLKDADIVLRTY